MLQQYIDEENKNYGGNLSVRFDKSGRSSMMIGQDESTYHQYIFSKNQWRGPAGHHCFLPKGVGDILMIPGFQSREFGLGLRDLLTPE